MSKHFRDTSHNLITSELLFRTWRYQMTSIGNTLLLTILLYIFIFYKVIVEDFLFNHPFAIQRFHHFHKALMLIERW